MDLSFILINSIKSNVVSFGIENVTQSDNLGQIDRLIISLKTYFMHIYLQDLLF